MFFNQDMRMDAQRYFLPAATYSTEIIISKSRFISTIRKLASLEEMREFYRDMQKKHPRAHHNCWAAVAGAPTDTGGYGCSDDGEPNGTAGKPMLKVLQHSGLGRTGLVITRYFGGVKLGTGGLVRAYTAAAQAAVTGVKRGKYVSTRHLRFILPYDQEATFRYILKQFGPVAEEYSYTDKITVDIHIAEDQAAAMSATLKAQLGHGLYVEILS